MPSHQPPCCLGVGQSVGWHLSVSSIKPFTEQTHEATHNTKTVSLTEMNRPKAHLFKTYPSSSLAEVAWGYHFVPPNRGQEKFHKDRKFFLTKGLATPNAFGGHLTRALWTPFSHSVPAWVWAILGEYPKTRADEQKSSSTWQVPSRDICGSKIRCTYSPPFTWNEIPS